MIEWITLITELLIWTVLVWFIYDHMKRVDKLQECVESVTKMYVQLTWRVEDLEKKCVITQKTIDT
jgi:hypothetical protein